MREMLLLLFMLNKMDIFALSHAFNTCLQKTKTRSVAFTHSLHTDTKLN